MRGRGLLWNLILALAWIALTGTFSPENFFLGFALGLAILYFTSRTFQTSYVNRLGKAIGLVGFFVWQLILANFQIAYDLITPRHHIRPAIIAVPLSARTDHQITLLCNLVTITPGAIALDVSADRQVLYVYEMYVRDPEEARRKIKDGYERRIMEVMG